MASVLDDVSAGASASSGAGAGAGEAGGIGEEFSENVSRTVRKDATDPLSLASSPRSPPFGTTGGDDDSTTTRGGANGITIGFGGGLGGGVWFRRALRNGTFGAMPGDVGGIGRRGGGGSEVGRRDDDGVAVVGGGGDVTNTLGGAKTDSNARPLPPSPRRLYSDTGGGARTLNKPPPLIVLPPGPVGRPAFARSHAVRLFRVTPSTIAMSDIWPDPTPASGCACGGGDDGIVYVTDLLLPC